MEILIEFCYTSHIVVEESNVQTLLPAACLLQLAEIQVSLSIWCLKCNWETDHRYLHFVNLNITICCTKIEPNWQNCNRWTTSILSSHVCFVLAKRHKAWPKTFAAMFEKTSFCNYAAEWHFETFRSESLYNFFRRFAASFWSANSTPRTVSASGHLQTLTHAEIFSELQTGIPLQSEWPIRLCIATRSKATPGILHKTFKNLSIMDL